MPIPQWLCNHFHEAVPERPWLLQVPAHPFAVGDVVGVATHAEPSEVRLYRIVASGLSADGACIVALVAVDAEPEDRIVAPPLQTRVTALAGVPFVFDPPSVVA